MTNFERIKNMSVEEYAKHIFRLIDCRYCPVYCTNGNCKDAIEQWLKSEAEIKNKYGDDVQILNPAILPEGMLPADYMRICFAMIDTAHVIVFLPNAIHSDGAMLELDYAKYTRRKYVKELHDFVEHSIAIPTNE